MSTYKYDIPMPEDYKKLLLNIVQLSKQERSLSGLWWGAFDELLFSIGKENKTIPGVAGDPFLSFDALGMMEIIIGARNSYPIVKNAFILKPAAFEWADYQKKTFLGKWLEKFPEQVKTPIILISFILSVTLTIIQILQAIPKK